MLIGGYLSDPELSPFFSPSLPFWITAAITLLGLFVVLRFYSETHKTTEPPRIDILKGFRSIRQALTFKKARPIFVAIFIWSVGWGLAVQWFPAYSILAFNTSQQTISWGMLILGLFYISGGLVVNPLLLKKLTSLPMAILAMGFCSLFLLFSSFSHGYFLFSLLVSIASIFTAFGFSNSVNYISINCPAEIQGKMMGLSQSMLSLGRVVIPIIGGYIGGADAHLFYPIATICVFGAFLILLKEQFSRRKSQSE